MTLNEILAATGLSDTQARWALKHLIRAGEVIMEGAQGVRDTRYGRVIDSSG